MSRNETTTGPDAPTPLEQALTADALPQNPCTTDPSESPVAAPGDSNSSFFTDTPECRTIARFMFPAPETSTTSGTISS